ncbi:MAG: hypothetical protein AMXMBFR64_50190 [Myxococcales bacterium]
MCSHPLMAPLLAVALVLLPRMSFAEPAHDEVLHRARTDLGNIESSIKQLQEEFARPVAQGATYDLEKRLVDARVHYDLRHYDMASILLLDLVENPVFKKNTDYTEALWLLGHSLYLERNWLAARQYFDELVLTRAPQANDAMRLLVEIALNLGWSDKLADLVKQLERAWGSAAPGVKYAWGKALLRLGRDRDAATRLAEVPPGDPFYGPSRYYLGVVSTGWQDYEQAISYFREAMVAEPGEDADSRVREQAALSVGRLSAELGLVDAAVDAYQTIDRRSPWFEDALYEMAYAYAAQGRLEQALHTLDVLLLTVQDEQLAVDASVLRARVQLQMNVADDASESYKDVIGRFTPIKNELEDFARSDKNLARYFEWLLRRHSDQVDVAAPLSARTAAFVERVDTMKPVLSLFADMARERADVKESMEIAALLDAALSSSSRVDIFPALQAGWVRIMESENRLLVVTRDTLDAEAAMLLRSAGADDRARVQELVAERRALEERFTARVPHTVADYKERRREVDERFDALKRDAFVTEQGLQRVREQLAAMDKVLTDARYAAQVAPGSGEHEKAMLADLEVEKESLKALYDELEQVKRDIDLENARIGVGDFATTAEGNIKNQLIAAHKREHELYRRLSGALPSDERRVAEAFGQVRSQAMDDFAALGAILDRIQRSADDKIALYKRLIALERDRLASYKAEAATYEAESRRVAKEVGNALFRDAQAKVTAVVLEADLGLLDIAWAEKQAKSDRIAELSQEKADRLSQLQEALKSIVEEEGFDAPAPPPSDPGDGDADEEEPDEGEGADE